MIKHNILYSIFCFLLIFLFQPQYGNGQSDLLKVAESLQKSEGKVTIYYPATIEKQAKSIQALIEKAVEYYNTHLGINIPISVILFGPEEYRLYTKEKFGKSDPYNEFLPFVAAGPPTVMCLPAISGSALDSLTQMAIKQSSSSKSLHLSIQEISQRFTALVGLHELGHQYMRELEIGEPVHWFQEMMANFIADAFLTDVSEADAQIWQLVTEAYVTYLKPVNKTFSGIHKGNQENYVWWQGNITLIAHEVYKKYGFDFVRKLQQLNNVKIFPEDDLSFIIALEEIAPGFEQWAEKYGHISNEDKIKMNGMRKEVINETKNALAQNMPNPYTATYSMEWKQGDSSFKKIVMQFLKGFETNNFKYEDLLAEFMGLYLSGANDFFEKSLAIVKLKEFRAGFHNLKIRLQSVISLKSVDVNDNWVFAFGSLLSTLENGQLQNLDFFMQFKINDQGKINRIKLYEFVEAKKAR
jgi:hypothetical protein